MESFTASEIIKFIQIVNCMSIYRFKEMYEAVLWFVSDGYVNEKFNSCNRNIGFWICSLDGEVLEKMMKYCLED